MKIERIEIRSDIPGPSKFVVAVTFNNARELWCVEFLELLDIINYLFHCEDKKYPKNKGFEGRNMFYRAITAVYHEMAPKEALKCAENKEVKIE